MTIRKNNRLLNFDYSSNHMYFVTVCTHNKKKILSEIITVGDFIEPDVKLSEFGIVCKALIEKYNRDNMINIPHYIIMPNHIHLIVDMTINPEVKFTLPNIIRGIKSLSKRNLSKAFRDMHGDDIWQKSYYDRVIRNEKEYYEFVKYIEENPLKWDLDEYWYSD